MSYFHKSTSDKTMSTKAAAEVIPDYLIYEVLDGQPLYYKGYQEVLAGRQKLEDIVGSSGLQFFILEYFLRLIVKSDPDENYIIGNNEAGLHLEAKNNLANDIALYSGTVLTPDKITPQYVDVPPEMVIEVDLKIAFEGLTPPDYINLKTQKLLDFGVKKVIWAFTRSRKVTVATEGQPWITDSWDNSFELFNGVEFNIGAHLREKGVNLDPKAS